MQIRDWFIIKILSQFWGVILTNNFVDELVSTHKRCSDLQFDLAYETFRAGIASLEYIIITFVGDFESIKSRLSHKSRCHVTCRVGRLLVNIFHVRRTESDCHIVSTAKCTSWSRGSTLLLGLDENRRIYLVFFTKSGSLDFFCADFFLFSLPSADSRILPHGLIKILCWWNTTSCVGST